MAVNAKAVKARINSAKNTKKITKAMELVSAAKMRKAIQASANTRMYSQLMRELLQHLAHIDEPNIPLLEIRKVEKVLAIIISSNRGLCGSFNSNVFKELGSALGNSKELSTLENRSGEKLESTDKVEIDIIGIGKKSASFARKFKHNLVAVFDNIKEKPAFEEILPISKIVIDGYITKKYDKVIIGFTNFKSSLNQIAEVRQLLPLSPKDLQPNLEKTTEVKSSKFQEVNIEEYIFEPNLGEILETIVPKLIEVQLYQMILESAASEHSSRMIAMKNASDNAGDLIEDLTREYNKARQAAITQEIAEIAGGAAALS